MKMYLVLFMQGAWCGALIVAVLNVVAGNAENATLFLLTTFYIDYKITNLLKEG